MNRAYLIAVLPLLALLALWGCDNDTNNVVDGPGSGVPVTDKTCLGCHSDQAELEATADEEEGSKFTRYDKGDG